MEFASDIRIVNLELFDAAFLVVPGEEEDVKRRFMTLFAHDASGRRGGSGEVLKVTNAQGESFALKQLHVEHTQDGSYKAPDPGELNGRDRAAQSSAHDGTAGPNGHDERDGRDGRDGADGYDQAAERTGDDERTGAAERTGDDERNKAADGSLACAGEHTALAADYATQANQAAQTPNAPRKILRNSVDSSGRLTDAPDYVTQGHIAAFYEEYRTHLAVSSLRGFPKLYGFGFAGGNPVIVMEWVEGSTLRDALRDRAKPTEKPLSLETIAKLGIAVLDLLERAAQLDAHFVHRDISPRNIMLRSDRIPPDEQLDKGEFDICLIDFGSAALTEIAAGGAPDPTFTANANIWRMGTPAYAPPEMLSADIQLPAAYRQSPTIDTYALCSVLYELYAGDKPFDLRPGDVRSPYRLKTETLPARLAVREPDGGALAGAIMTGLSPQQDDRPSVAELKAALNNWQRFPGKRATGALRGAKASNRGMWQPEYARKVTTRRAFLAAGIVVAGALAATAILASGKPTRAGSIDPSRYPRANALYNGEPLFKVLDGEHPGWALCTAEGAIACKPASSRECGALREGLVMLYDDASGLYGYITPTAAAGNDSAATSNSPASAANAAHDGNSVTSDAEQLGYAWAILPQFAQAQDFSEGLAAAQDPETRLWGYIDTQGSWVIRPQFASADAFSAKTAAVQTPDLLYGAIDRTGAFVIDPRFTRLGSRSADGFAVAEESPGCWGIVDSQGAWTSEARFPALRRAAHAAERCLVPALNPASGTWGFVDELGAWAIGPTFRDARPFSEGLAAVQDEKTQLWYFFEPRGSASGGMQPRFWKLGDLHDGLAPAQASAEDSTVVLDEADPDARVEFAGKRYGYVDAQGAWQMKRLTTLVDTALRSAQI